MVAFLKRSPLVFQDPLSASEGLVCYWHNLSTDSLSKTNHCQSRYQLFIVLIRYSKRRTRNRWKNMKSCLPLPHCFKIFIPAMFKLSSLRVWEPVPREKPAFPAKPFAFLRSNTPHTSNNNDIFCQHWWSTITEDFYHLNHKNRFRWTNWIQEMRVKGVWEFMGLRGVKELRYDGCLAGGSRH